MVDPLQPFRYIITILQFQGLWPGKKHKTLYNIFSLIFNFFFSFCFISFELFNITQAKDLSEVTENLFISLTEISTIIKLIIFFFRRDQIKNMLTLIKINFITKNELEDKIMRQDIQFTTTIFILFIVTIGGVISAAAFVPFVSETPTLPFPIWLPFNWKEFKILFWIAFFYDILGVTLHGLINLSNDCIIMFLTGRAATQLDILGIRLKNLKNSKNNHEELKDLMKQYDCIVE